MKKQIKPLLRWIKEMGDEEAGRLCAKAGTSLGYMRQIAYGNKIPSAEKCVAIERVTGVGRPTLRPKDWKLIWPELAASR